LEYAVDAEKIQIVLRTRREHWFGNVPVDQRPTAGDFADFQARKGELGEAVD